MQTSVYRDVKDVAKDIRRTLKATFPNTRFAVRVNRFSGGSSCDVYWIDGPTESAVNQALGPVIATDKGEARYEAYGDYWNGSHYYMTKRAYSPLAYHNAAEELSRTRAEFKDLPRFEVHHFEHHAMKGQYIGSLITDSWDLSDSIYRLLREKEL